MGHPSAVGMHVSASGGPVLLFRNSRIYRPGVGGLPHRKTGATPHTLVRVTQLGGRPGVFLGRRSPCGVPSFCCGSGMLRRRSSLNVWGALAAGPLAQGGSERLPRAELRSPCGGRPGGQALRLRGHAERPPDVTVSLGRCVWSSPSAGSGAEVPSLGSWGSRWL